MTTVQKVLIGALAAQTLLAVGTRFPSGGPTAPRDLIGFPSDEVAKITITGRFSKGADAQVPEPPVQLVREGDGWVVASLDNYPADNEMMKPLLEALDKMDVRDPVANTEASRLNLEVSDQRYTRKLEVESKAGEKRTLYLGAAQGKSAHVRVDGEEDAYTVSGFNAWTVSEQANRYFNREFLKVDPATVSSLTVERPGVPPIALTKGADGKWTMPELPVGKMLEASATNLFLTKLLTVRMADPHGKAETPEMKLGSDALAKVTWTSGEPPETHSYAIGADIEGKSGRVYVRSDLKPFTVEVMKANLKSALEPKVEDLITDEIVDIDLPDAPTAP